MHFIASQESYAMLLLLGLLVCKVGNASLFYYVATRAPVGQRSQGKPLVHIKGVSCLALKGLAAVN